MSAAQTLAAPGVGPLAALAKQRDLLIALALVGTVTLMVLPVPPFLLDLLLAVSLCVSLAIFLISVYIEKPLEFSAFPALLLVITLFRLSLNVATTRLILLHGNEGETAAGAVVRAFGSFVLGGNMIVGVVIFLILVVVNFVVITKGAGRVAEVAARFTLDSLPGKQMSIDADLNAGHINEQQARERRKAVEREADFYGAMDGASKFVRGDAIAALLITGINILAGFAVGVLQLGMDALTAARTYTTLTVGDGLISQIPALLISTAAGIVTTRAASGGDLGGALADQLLARRRPLMLTGGILVALALVPGMPHFAFIAMGGAMLGLGWRAPDRPDPALAAAGGPAGAAGQGPRAGVTPGTVGAEAQRATEGTLEPEEALALDFLELQVGFELVPLVDAARGGDLLRRIAGLRKQIAQDLGILVPPVHVRDNLRLRPGQYILQLLGNEIARGELRLNCFLAMDPGGQGAPAISGESTKEPAFGLDAKWVALQDRERAEAAGYTVVDPPTVAATHIGEVLRQNAHELIGRREAQQLVEVLAKTNPKVVEELIPALMPLGEVIKVLRNLLREGIAVRDLRTIFEALADHAAQTKDTDALTELVRQRMQRHITARLKADDGNVHALFLDPPLEDAFRQAGRTGNAAFSDPREMPRILAALERAVLDIAMTSYVPVLVTAPDVRRTVSTFAARHVPGLAVVSYREIDPKIQIRSLGVVERPAS